MSTSTTTARTSVLQCVCKLRCVPYKGPEQPMILKNFEALRLMANAILLEKEGKFAEAAQVEMMAVKELERELNAYLGGIKQTVQFESADGGSWSMDIL